MGKKMWYVLRLYFASFAVDFALGLTVFFSIGLHSACTAMLWPWQNRLRNEGGGRRAKRKSKIGTGCRWPCARAPPRVPFPGPSTRKRARHDRMTTDLGRKFGAHRRGRYWFSLQASLPVCTRQPSCAAYLCARRARGAHGRRTCARYRVSRGPCARAPADRLGRDWSIAGRPLLGPGPAPDRAGRPARRRSPRTRVVRRKRRAPTDVGFSRPDKRSRSVRISEWKPIPTKHPWHVYASQHVDGFGPGVCPLTSQLHRRTRSAMRQWGHAVRTNYDSRLMRATGGRTGGPSEDSADRK